MLGNQRTRHGSDFRDVISDRRDADKFIQLLIVAICSNVTVARKVTCMDEDETTERVTGGSIY